VSMDFQRGERCEFAEEHLRSVGFLVFFFFFLGVYLF